MFTSDSASTVANPNRERPWHDTKMVVKWSTSDSVGYVQLWHNGVRQQFLDGTDTYHQNLVPGFANPTTYYKEGIYRPASSSTAIVYHSGFRSASSEAGL